MLEKCVFILLLLVLPSIAFAGSASNDWNNNWRFLSPSEKLNLREQALVMELMENGGFSSSYSSEYYSEQHQNCLVEGACFNANGDTTSIGTFTSIEGDNNKVESDNSGAVDASVNSNFIQGEKKND